MEKDKLVALSGVAKIILGKFPGLAYHAGLWGHELEYRLLWHSLGGSNRPQSYRAPSWSWASIDGSISPGAVPKVPHASPVAEILEAVTKPLGADPTGQVESGFIRLVGPFMTFSITGRHINIPSLTSCVINGKS